MVSGQTGEAAEDRLEPVPATRAEAGARILQRMREQEEALAAKGWHRLSPWWWQQYETWLTSECRQFVGRVGRQGGKSQTCSRWAVAEATAGLAKIPDGTEGVFAILSVEREDSARRIRTIAAILKALGYTEVRASKTEIRQRGDFVARMGASPEIEVWGDNGPRKIKAYTASIAGVSGFTCFGAFCDEVSKWSDDGAGTNPATEVISSLGPTMITQPLARIALISSPWSTLDAHHAAFAAGSIPGRQHVAYAPSWVANPAITKERTHELEPDDLKWSREYEAIPMPATTTVYFDPAAIDRSMAEHRRGDI